MPIKVVVLCNVATLPDAFVAKTTKLFAPRRRLLIFAGDRFQPDHYNQKLAQVLPAPLRDKKTGAESAGEKIDKIDIAHPALQIFTDTILQDSIKSARVWSYARSGGKPLIALANGDPLLLEQRVGAGKVMLIATSATATGAIYR
jgi:hypothetical protein